MSGGVWEEKGKKTIWFGQAIVCNLTRANHIIVIAFNIELFSVCVDNRH